MLKNSHAEKHFSENEFSGGLVHKQEWSPYQDNGGTLCGLAGKGFCVLAADKRLSSGYNILSRNVSKIEKINARCLVGGGGMHSDRTLLLKVLRTRAKQYEFENFKPISGAAVASMLSTELYSRRFFPYYVFSMAATLNEDGNGALYGYDAVGCAEKVEYSTSGSGGIMAHSFLDNQVGFKTHPANKKELTLSESIELVKKTFLALSERDIFTGDKGEICVLTADGLERVEFELRKD